MAVSKEGTIVINAEARGFKQLQSEVGGVESAIAKFTTGAGLAGVALGGITAVTATAVTAFKNLATEADKFSALSRIYSGNIEAAQRATHGLISEMDIMASKAKMVTLGVELTDKEFVQLLESTQKLAPVMGLEMGDALDSLSTALARGSLLVADNLGLIVSQEVANEKYAKALGKSTKELTEQEKKLALQKEMKEQLIQKAKELPEAVDSGTKSFTRFAVELKDAVLPVIGFVNEALGEGIGVIGRTNQKIIDFVVSTATLTDISDYRARQEALRRQASAARDLEVEFEERSKATQKRINAAMEEAIKGHREAALGPAVTDKDEREVKRRTYEDDLRDEEAARKKAAEAAKKRAEEQRRVEIDAAKAKADHLVAAINAEDEQRKQSLKFHEFSRQAQSELAEFDEKRFQAQREVMQAKRAAEQEARDDTFRRFADNPFQGLIEGKRALAEASQASALAMSDWRLEFQLATDSSIVGMAVQGFADMTAGIWAAADAAVLGSESFGKGMAKIVKSVLMGIAQMATVEAAKELALAAGAFAASILGGPAFGAAGTAHLVAAAKWGVLAGVTGGSALAMSSGGVGAKEEKEQRARRPGGTPTGRTSFGEAKRSEMPPIVVQLYVKPGDSAADILKDRKLSARIAAAQAQAA